MMAAGTRALAKSIRPASFLKTTGIILFLFFVVSKVLSLPESLLAILGVLWFLYVPLGIGNLFIMTPIKPIKRLSNYFKSLNVVKIFIEWFIGLILILLVTAFANQLSMVNILGPIFLLAAAISFHLESRTFKTKSKFFFNRSIIWILIIGSILGLTFGIYIRSFSPYPLTVGFDLFEHIHVAKSVLNGPIDTNSVVYLPTFDTLIGLGSATFNASVISIFWIGPVMLFGLFGISLYAMSYWITKNHICAFIGSFIGLSVTEFGNVPNLPHFYPASFVMCMFPLAFVIVDMIWRKTSKDKICSIILTLIIFSGLIVIHYELGLVATSILSLYLIMLYATKSRLFLAIIRIITICAGIGTLMYFWGYTHFQIQIAHLFDQSHMIDYTYLYDIPTKLRNLSQFYTTQVMLFSILGLVALSFFKERKAVIVGFIALVLLLIDFQQIAIVDRILTLIRPLLSISAAVLLMMPSLVILKRLSSSPTLTHTNPKSKSFSIHQNLVKFFSDKIGVITLSSQITRLSIAYGVIIIILLLTVLVKPYQTYLEPFYSRGDTFSNFNSEELAAAKWIEKNTSRNYLVFSDPFTSIEMKGLAFRENIEGIGWNLTVARLVKAVMTSQNASEAHDKIVSNNVQNVMIIIAPRTSQWLKVNDLNSKINRTSYFLEFPIHKFVTFEGFNKFFNAEYFDLKYHSNNIFVFTLVASHKKQ